MNTRLAPPRVAQILGAGALVVLLASACGDDGLDANLAGSANAPATTAVPATGVGALDRDEVGQGSGASAPPTVSAPAATPRTLIVDASVAVETDDVERAVREASRIATEAGGLVTDADVRLDAPAIASVTLRVPPDRVDGVLDALGALGRVTARGKSATDVTATVVDLESRIASARKSVDRAREFLDKATKVSDLAALEAELANRELALEQLLAQQRELDDLSSLASVVANFTAPEAPGVVAPAEPDDERPTPLGALKGGLAALGNLFLGLVIVLAAIAPFLAAAALVWLVGRRPARAAATRLRARRATRRVAAAARSVVVPPPPVVPPVPSGARDVTAPRSASNEQVGPPEAG